MRNIYVSIADVGKCTGAIQADLCPTHGVMLGRVMTIT